MKYEVKRAYVCVDGCLNFTTLLPNVDSLGMSQKGCLHFCLSPPLSFRHIHSHITAHTLLALNTTRGNSEFLSFAAKPNSRS